MALGGWGPLQATQTGGGLGRSWFRSQAALTHCGGCSESVIFPVEWMLTIPASEREKQMHVREGV